MKSTFASRSTISLLIPVLIASAQVSAKAEGLVGTILPKSNFTESNRNSNTQILHDGDYLPDLSIDASIYNDGISTDSSDYDLQYQDERLPNYDASFNQYDGLPLDSSEDIPGYPVQYSDRPFYND